MDNQVNEVAYHASMQISDALIRAYPRGHVGEHQTPSIPYEHVAEIADALTSVIANVIATYLDAGSERDAVHESLGPVIQHELVGWSDNQELADKAAATPFPHEILVT